MCGNELLEIRAAIANYPRVQLDEGRADALALPIAQRRAGHAQVGAGLVGANSVLHAQDAQAWTGCSRCFKFNDVQFEAFT